MDQIATIVKQKIKQAGIIDEIANVWDEVFREMWKDQKDEILEDDPKATYSQTLVTDFEDNAYELLDTINEYIEEEVKKKLKKKK